MSKISDRRRADILHAALAEFGFRGVDGASMSEIAARAGIGKSTIYEYFSSKADLLIASCKSKIRQIEEQLQSIFTQDIPFSKQMELYIEMMVKLSQEVNFNEILRMFIHNSIKDFEAIMEQFSGDIAATVEQAIRRAQAAGELVPDLDVDVMAAYLVSLPNPHLIFRLQQLGKEDPVNAVVELALRGIRTEASHKDT